MIHFHLKFHVQDPHYQPNLTESAFQSRILTPKRLWNLFSSFQLQIMNLIVLTCWSSLSKLDAYIWTPMQHSGQFWRFDRIWMIACHMEVAQSLAFWFIDSAFKQQTKIIREKSKINCTPNSFILVWDTLLHIFFCHIVVLKTSETRYFLDSALRLDSIALLCHTSCFYGHYSVESIVIDCFKTIFLKMAFEKLQWWLCGIT